uniref:Uncharacterized protein n=1 Tax=Cacopsylla melanoneura TaxID=428564 RepID=A0A8D9EQ22_9HEMI
MASKNTPFQVTLALTAIGLTYFLLQSEATKKSVQMIKGTLSVTDLCVNNKVDSCTGLTLDQATGICNTSNKFTLNFTEIEEVQCDGATCHLGIATNDPKHTVVIECHQNGTIASCTCYFYSK